MKIEEQRIQNLVIGSGAAGYTAAIRLWERDERDTAMITEEITAGTSRNTGSDKQTYYKLSLAAGNADSVLAMAEDLFAGGCVDGDLALCEAAGSVRSFFHLVEAGVPFPCTEHGEYMGYRTDHDHGRRATSAGPYTSKMMTECLQWKAEGLGIPIINHIQIIRLLVHGSRIYGVLCLNKDKAEPSYLIIWCENVILATGGPAGMYRDSVYPTSQLGSSGLAFEAGVKGKNLMEWQYGMASIRPRWNVSGTYMQVLPRFFSANTEGGDAHEFLNEYFDDPGKMLNAVFLKGYQWPFDVSRIFGGSSVIDLLVYQETVMRGRRVFLDFTQNPGGRELDFSQLSPEAFEYLQNARACFGSPVERLQKMNQPAIDFYREHNVNLWHEPLEIAICAQHNNGGLSTDAWWETNVHGLFAVGEVCGSHGVNRPGGAALNAGQVGGTRAAERIALRHLHNDIVPADPAIEDVLRKESECFVSMPEQASGSQSAGTVWRATAGLMSDNGAMIRSAEGLAAALAKTEDYLNNYLSLIKVQGNFAMFFRLREMLISQKVYLSAMLAYQQSGAGSRGSALYTDENGVLFSQKMPELFRCHLDNGVHSGEIQEIIMTDNGCNVFIRPVRPIPRQDYFFENQWRSFRERELKEG